MIPALAALIASGREDHPPSPLLRRPSQKGKAGPFGPALKSEENAGF